MALQSNLPAKVRIVIVGPFYPLRGGIAHFGASLAHALSARGHAVFPISFSRLYPKLLFPGKSQEESGAEPPRYPIRAEALLDSLNPLSWLKTARHILALKPDAVVFTHWMTFFAPCYATVMRYLKGRARTKLILLLHNFKPHEKRFGDDALLWLLTRLPDGYLTLSDKVKSDLLVTQPNAIAELSPHPIYNIFGEAMTKAEARRALGLSASQKVALFFGYIRKYKGLDLLLEAMPALIKIFPDFKLIVAGEFYADESAHREKIKSLGIAAHLLLATDYIPSNEVAKYFCAADCAVLPYRSATQSGVVPIAYHFELPVIVTNVGGLSEVAIDGKTGFVIEPNSAQAIVEGVKKFFDARDAVDFAANIRAEKKKYSWEAFAEAVERLALRLG